MILITIRIMIIIITLLLFFVALVYHVPQFLEKCGCIFKVNCQPVEKKKKKAMGSHGFHRGTQKGGRNSKHTVQVMEKENRKFLQEYVTCTETKDHTLKSWRMTKVV